VLKMHEDGTADGDLKVTNTPLKELATPTRCFAPTRGAQGHRVRLRAHRGTDEAAVPARAFGAQMVQQAWMGVTAPAPA